MGPSGRRFQEAPMLRSLLHLPILSLLTSLTVVPVAAQTAGTWRALAPLPTARAEVAAAEVNGLIYVVGGFDSGGWANEAYDPASDSWSVRAPLPRPLNHPAAAGLNGKLY